MNKDILVSIIIPVYNGEKYISETIKKVLNQTWERLEIIVVNDGSSDNTEYEILDTKRRYDIKDNIKYIFKENKGAASARNEGIRNSKGDFIQFLDADDYMDNNKIENQVNLIIGSYNTIAFCGYKNDYGNKIIQVKNEKLNKSYKNPAKLLVNCWKFKKFNVIHSYLIPRDLVFKSGMWNEKINNNDDGEFMARVILNSKEIKFDNKSFVYYVFLKGSLSKVKSKHNYNSRIESYRMILHNYRKHNLSDIEMTKYYNQLVTNCMIEIRLKNYINYKEFSEMYPFMFENSSFKVFSILYRILKEKYIFKIYNIFFYKVDVRIQ